MALSALNKKALALHKKLKGKIRTAAAAPLKSRADLSLMYTPGVAAVSRLLARNPACARTHTIKGRSVLVVSDGSAVLGLGNIGPYGALPVMEGKAAIFKAFADIDAVPLVLGTQNPDEIVDTVCRIAPAFGGINLEDIAAPQCFDIERRIAERLDIPVMHDDQHGTAIAVLAGLINALRVTNKKLASARIVISGAGAAGTAIALLLRRAGAERMLVLDTQGIIARQRNNLPPHKQELAAITNPENKEGDARRALAGADVFIGVSGPNIVTAEDIRLMAPQAVVFALANPVPEIMPDAAKRGGAAIVATGRSDFPNQLNNALVFPGIFRGALDRGARKITTEIKLRAARNLAAVIRKPTAHKILPDIFDAAAVRAVAQAVR
jgi:malate dehydrogenase (oxaloacetate-decarboxylating)